MEAVPQFGRGPGAASATLLGVEFIPGLELSGRFYREAVRPLLERRFPGLVHTAALIGPGSEVLGFDTARSTDHDWGPRLQLFLHADDLACAPAVSEMLARELPASVCGYSTNLVPTGERGTVHMRPADGPVRHGVVVAEPGEWLTGLLGFDPAGEVDWLGTPTQVFAEASGGAVFHDGLGVEAVRRKLAWYPDDVWRQVLARHWHLVGEEESFVGRCGDVGDELGSAVIAARLTRELMRLCLLLARVYPPYSKWLGTAFARLPCGPRLVPVLTAVLAATDWRTRERHLCEACEIVAGLQNDAGLTEPIDPRTRPFHDRPYRVLDAGRFADALNLP
ncbi:DUF4037 domain-containing protein [Lentzea sp. NPDC006480]|uniref:DUF4037 domain-containing protein n=1 Tax=Lentzea sp. NPDC006480 TaxID=3157176 RepID=UPI0033AAAB0A